MAKVILFLIFPYTKFELNINLIPTYGYNSIYNSKFVSNSDPTTLRLSAKTIFNTALQRFRGGCREIQLMIFMKQVLFLFFVLTQIIASAQTPKNVIIFIGDGYGVAAKTAARMALGQGQDGARFSTDANFQLMAIDKLRYNTMLTTHSLNSWITDSAPGSTVYSAGKKGKVQNEAIAFNLNDNQSVETILESAKKNGYAVGLVTTTRITHATPADFAAHIWNRDLEDVIAAQLISKSQTEYSENFGVAYDSVRKHWVLPDPKMGVDIDVLLGGGTRQFIARGNASEIVRDAKGSVMTQTDGSTDTIRNLGSRKDGVDLIAKAKSRGYVYINSRDALLNLDVSQFNASNNTKLLGLFNASMLNYEQDRQLSAAWEPTLADMTDVAIKVLEAKSPKGFFLMVEGGRIDHLEHANAGGIAVSDDKKSIVLAYDKEQFSPDLIYSDTSANSKTTGGIYGSDYLIKEVLAFDYAIEKGRNLLKDKSAQTLIFSTSDHETGGLAVVGLHDQNSTNKIRTYAATPKQDAASTTTGTTASVNDNPRPVGLTAGANWFPNYSMVDFQGYKWPSVSKFEKRIVISYGSNPLANGNGTKFGSGPGNHTPADIFVGADDNVGGTVASKITGRGLLDNTDLTPIMKDFLGLNNFQTGVIGVPAYVPSFKSKIYPNPSNGSYNFEFKLEKSAQVRIDILTINGLIVDTLNVGKLNAGDQLINWNSKVNDSQFANGFYIYTIYLDNEPAASEKFLKK